MKKIGPHLELNHQPPDPNDVLRYLNLYQWAIVIYSKIKFSHSHICSANEVVKCDLSHMNHMPDITLLGVASLSTVKAVRHPESAKVGKEPWIQDCYDSTHACDLDQYIGLFLYWGGRGQSITLLL